MSESEFTVSPYDHAVHKGALLEFMSKVYAPDVLNRRERVLDWIHEHHPLCERKPLRFVIMDGDRVAATIGHLPAEFLVNGIPARSRITHDLLVDPAYRGKGLAKLIVGNALTCGAFLPGGMWMNMPCYKIHVASGFVAARPLVTRTLVLDPDAFAERKQLSGIKQLMGKTALTLLRNGALRRARKTTKDSTSEIRVLDEFDPETDDVWRELLGSYEIGMVRTAAHLNWKYARHPVLDYRIRIAERGGRTAGYLISRPSREDDDERRAVIADFLVENGDTKTLKRLVSHAIIEASDTGAQVLSVLTTQPWAARMLRSFGFLPRGETHTWVLGAWKEYMPDSWIKDHQRWHMCIGDSDGDLWTGAV
jgi:GNAT superfamily N-acetyltransferase